MTYRCLAGKSEIQKALLPLVVAVSFGAFILQPPIAAQQSPEASAPKGLPPNAKVREITPEEMKKYNEEARLKATAIPGPLIRAPKSGIKAIDPSVLQILDQQKLAAPALALHSPQPVVKTATQSTPQTAPPMQAATMTMARPLLQPQPGATPGTLMSSGGGASAGSSMRMAGTPPTSQTPPHQINPIAIAPPPTKIAYVCNTPLVIDVNHQPKNAVFTPEQEYNSYTIKGCFFGAQPGRAYLIGNFNAQPVNLETPYWSDNEIDARVDPKVSGEIDQQNVSLIIAPVGAAQIKTTGFRFIAARSNPAVFLASIPSSWRTNSGFSGQWSSPNPHYTSPVTTSSPKYAQGNSLYMERDMNKKFSPGSDYYTPQLATGWTIDSVQMTTYGFPPSCPGVVTYKQTFGSAFANLSGMEPDWTHLQRAGIHVDASDTSCSGFIPIAPPFVYYTYSDLTGSAYGLKVWARGPRCTDPYSGQPVQQCVQNVQMCGSESCGQ